MSWQYRRKTFFSRNLLNDNVLNNALNVHVSKPVICNRTQTHITGMISHLRTEVKGVRQSLTAATRWKGSLPRMQRYNPSTNWAVQLVPDEGQQDRTMWTAKPKTSSQHPLTVQPKAILSVLFNVRDKCLITTSPFIFDNIGGRKRAKQTSSPSWEAFYMNRLKAFFFSPWMIIPLPKHISSSMTWWSRAEITII